MSGQITENERTILQAAENILRDLDHRYTTDAYLTDDAHWTACRSSRIAGVLGAAASAVNGALIAIDVYGPKTEQPADSEGVTA